MAPVGPESILGVVMGFAVWVTWKVVKAAYLRARFAVLRATGRW